MFFYISISPQTNDLDFSKISRAIQERNLFTAKRELAKFLPENSNDPKVSFYQTEIWILEGEEEYKNKNFQIAKELYSKAYKTWPSNELVRRRYEELQKPRFYAQKKGKNEKLNLSEKHISSDSEKKQKEEIRSIIFEMNQEKKEGSSFKEWSTIDSLLIGIILLILVTNIGYNIYLRRILILLEKRWEKNLEKRG